MKRLISIVLALIMALPLGAISCFAVDGSNNGSWKVEDSDGKNISIYVYTDEKKPGSSSEGYLDLIKLLVYAGTIGFVAYEFRGPITGFAKTAPKFLSGAYFTWKTAGGIGNDIAIALGKVGTWIRHPLDLTGAYFDDFFNGNTPESGQKKSEQIYDKNEVPHKEDMTNVDGVISLALNGAGAGAVLAGALKAAAGGASLGRGQRVKSMCEFATAGVLGLSAMAITPVISLLTALGALAINGGVFLFKVAPALMAAAHAAGRHSNGQHSNRQR